jgi:predicted dienelactone hydrolase
LTISLLRANVVVMRASIASSLLLVAALAACSGGGSSSTPATDGPPPVDGPPGADGPTATDAAIDAAGSSAADPDRDGPFAVAELDGVIAAVTGGDSNVPVHAAYPTSAGSYPVVVIGHGMQLPASQYHGYARRLASFGYVAVVVDFPASPFNSNNSRQVRDLIAGIDFAIGHPTIGPRVDATRAGATGHSLGGKLALLAATMDPRIKAAFVLDPVDGGGPTGCNPPGCVTVATLMPDLHIPTGFIGETIDSAGGFQPCAPAASNYQTFYARTNPPSLSVTAVGANHMSFLDDVSTCGVVCSFCNPATATNASVNAMARAFTAAFYERYLRGNAAYDTYLTGAQAQARYVTTGRATIVSK